MRQSFLDPELESELLAAFLQKNEKVLNSDLQKSLKGELFSIKSFSWLVEKITKSRTIPAKELVRIDLEEHFEGDELEKHKSILLPLFTRQLSFVEESIGRFRDYLAFQIVSSKVKEVFEKRQKYGTSFWLRDLKEGIDEALSVWEGDELEFVDYASNFSEREMVRKERRNNPDLFARVRLGIEDFDSQIQMGKGTVTNFLAPFKRYKSVILCSVGWAALLQGFNVLHVVYENTIELTTNRYDSMFSGIALDRVVNYLKTFEEKNKLDELMNKVDSWPHRLKIVKASPYKSMVDDIQRVSDRLEKEENFVVDVAVFDYLNLICPSKNSTEERLRNEQSVWDLQEYSKEMGKEKVIVTASQAKTEALEVDRLDSSHQGKSIGISQAVDATIAINQTKEEWRDGIIVLAPLYIRDGQILKEEIILRSDISRMCLSREQEDLWKEVEFD